MGTALETTGCALVLWTNLQMVPPYSIRILAFLSIGSTVLLSCFSFSDNEDEAVLRFSIAESFVEVTIVNPKKNPAELHRIEKSKSTFVATLPAKARQSVELSSGIYQLKFGDKQQFCVAVPAIAEVTRQLKIELREPPANRKGWCWIPSGPAIVGDTLGIGAEDERPLELVSIPGFWLSEKEITNKQYAEFLSQQDVVDPSWIDLGSRKCRIKKAKDSYETDAPELPVVMVSFQGAKAYCRWRSEQLGEACRLPTEQEWEKAARGPASFVYSYGNVYKQSEANQESGTLKKVGQYSPNGFGLYDMTGNAFEWTSNLYDPENPDAIMNQSLRGGSFVLDGMYLRNSFRMRQSPSVMTDDIGFRVLIDQAKGE